MSKPDLDVIDRYHIAGRGDVVIVLQSDQPHQIGDTVMVDGKPRRVTGIESFAVPTGVDPGQEVGLLLAP